MTRSRSVVKTIQRASRGVKALLAVATLLTSMMGFYQSFHPLVEDWFGIGPSVSCGSAIETLSVAISSEKYQYRIGENVSVYYYISSNGELRISAEKPDGTRVASGTFLAKTAGTYRAVLGSAWYPTGFRRVIAEASSGRNVAHAVSYYIVAERYTADLAPLGAGAKIAGGAFYNSSFQLLELDADDNVPGMDREVTRFPGQSIGGSISYRLWSPSNLSADQMWQVVLVYSWAQSWPPSEYQVLYSGSPGSFPVPTSSTRFNITAPSVPGVYYVWILVCPSKTVAEAISNLEAPLGLPAHLRLVVKPKLKSALFLTVTSSNVPWGSSVAVNGRVEPSTSGANVTLCYSRSQAEDPLLLGHITTNTVGEYDRGWAPPSLGNYVIVASWSGSEETEPATSAPVMLTVVFPWANVAIILTLLSVGVTTTFYLLRTAMREKHPRRRTRSKTGQRRERPR